MDLEEKTKIERETLVTKERNLNIISFAGLILGVASIYDGYVNTRDFTTGLGTGILGMDLVMNFIIRGEDSLDRFGRYIISYIEDNE